MVLGYVKVASRKKVNFYFMKKIQSTESVLRFCQFCPHFKLRQALLRSVIITALLIYTNTGHSQQMTGLWKGTYEMGTAQYPIHLNFIRNADSTYTVYSYSWTTKTDGSDTTCVCEAAYQFLGEDSLYLEEKYVVLPENPVQICLQKMYMRLKVKKNTLELKGAWKTTDSNCKDSGFISFYKKRED
jgi:hypothetical protein